jgi:hypothetical protein
MKTLGVPLMTEKKDIKQTAVRVERTILRKAKFYLDEENKTLQELLESCLVGYVHQRDQEREHAAPQPRRS